MYDMCQMSADEIACTECGRCDETNPCVIDTDVGCDGCGYCII